jgi:hypothetical protein
MPKGYVKISIEKKIANTTLLKNSAVVAKLLNQWQHWLDGN